MPVSRPASQEVVTPRPTGSTRSGKQAARQRRSALGRFDARREAAVLCGIDEVGRGPLAGPVVAAAVILAPGARLPGVDDSKRLSPDERRELNVAVRRQARSLALATVPAPKIDRLNIRQATFEAMRGSLAALHLTPDLILVDGHERIPGVETNQEAVIGGDRRSLAIAAASIVAKVWRDELMIEFDRLFPGYGFAQHKGYGTAEHLEALARLGPCPIHRRSFAPVRQCAQMVLL